jgi:predicted dehydrogenase
MPLTKETRLLRVGILGCGPIAQTAHFEACRKARNVELYSICDVAEDLLVKMAAMHEPQVTYRNYDDMLADPRVEAVIVATADQFHVPICRQALAAGKHVLVEKPMGVTVESCEDLCRQVDETGLVLQVGHNRRFDPGVVFAHRFIREELGDIISLKAWYYDSYRRYTMTDNLLPIVETSRRAKRPDGNPKADKQRYFMLTHGSHLVDMVRFLGSEIISVRARLVEKFGAYCWFADVELSDGSVGHLDLNIAVRGDFEEGFRIFGELGSVDARLHLPWFHKSGHVECFSAKDGQYHRLLGEDAHTYKLQVEGFADAVLHDRPLLGAGVEDGLAAMRAMVAIARSAETGDRVRLADVTGGV